MNNQKYINDNGIVSFNGYMGKAPMSVDATVSALNAMNLLCEGYESQITKLTEQFNSLALDFGLSELSVRSKIDLLRSCETALGDRDIKVDKLTEQNKILREALESICRMDNYVDIDIAAKEALEDTKC
jgi:hypothetical protein